MAPAVRIESLLIGTTTCWIDVIRRTRQYVHVIAGKHGSFDYQAYPVYTLPGTSTLGESGAIRPICNLTHASFLLSGGIRRVPSMVPTTIILIVIPTLGTTPMITCCGPRTS